MQGSHHHSTGGGWRLAQGSWALVTTVQVAGHEFRAGRPRPPTTPPASVHCPATTHLPTHPKTTRTRAGGVVHPPGSRSVDVP